MSIAWFMLLVTTKPVLESTATKVIQRASSIQSHSYCSRFWRWNYQAVLQFTKTQGMRLLFVAITRMVENYLYFFLLEPAANAIFSKCIIFYSFFSNLLLYSKTSLSSPARLIVVMRLAVFIMKSGVSRQTREGSVSILSEVLA